MNDTNLITLSPEAHSKAEIKAMVNTWCNSGDDDDLRKYIQLKEMDLAVKEGIEVMRPRAKKSYLEKLKGAIDKTHFYGVTVSTQSTLKKNALAKVYIFSDELDALQKEVDELDQQLSDKKDLLSAMKIMEINNGTAKEVSAGGIVGEESTPTKIEDTINLVIKFPDQK